MNRYENTAPQAAIAETPPGPAQEVWGVLVYAITGSVAIIVFGAVLLLAANMLAWELLRLFVAVASLPWVFVGVLLILATWKQSIALLERLTGQDLDGSGQVGDVVRLVSFKGSGNLIDTGNREIPEDDLRHFIERGFVIGTTQTAWRGSKMPSGKTCDTNYHKDLVGVLTEHGLIEGVRKGASGHWTVDTAREALDTLGLNEVTKPN